ncbi:unnamed protein product [Effrenium voratum]|uniref:Uncharacterized protein n=1 Tax=Effrenium voratum TaxID=2562239 RepID=A0AA36IJK1_9DINO|nr:unnamed protein product [Effrenium voratum]
MSPGGRFFWASQTRTLCFVLWALTIGADAAASVTPQSARAECCDPLAQSGQDLQLVAALGYRLTLAEADLAGDPEAALLRVVGANSGCEAGEVLRADFANASENSWPEVRVPFQGTYSLCYLDNSSTSAWQQVPNITLFAHGAPASAAVRSYCPGENSSCWFHVPLDAGAVQLKRGGCTGSPALLTAAGSGWYLLEEATDALLDVCFCDSFEFQASDGLGFCGSSEDFLQPLGYLQLLPLSVPGQIFGTQSFSISVDCNATDCSSALLRFVDPQDGSFGGAADLCRTNSPNTALSSCISSGPLESCALSVALATLRFGQPQRGRLAPSAAAVGVCFCDGLSGCSAATSWQRIGQLTVQPLQLPETFLAAVTEELRIASPGGRFNAAERHFLKLLPDAGDFEEADCSLETNHSDLCEEQCRPAEVADEELTWQAQVYVPGWYAACYCSTLATCQAQDWQLLGILPVTGVSLVSVGATGATGGSKAARGQRIEVQLRGLGFRTGDRLTLGGCQGMEATPMPGAFSGAILSSTLEGSRWRLHLSDPHGLQRGDAVDLGFGPITVISATDTEILVESAPASASWSASSRAAFEARLAAPGAYEVCWSRGSRSFLVGAIDVVHPPSFPSEWHLTTSLPRTRAPSVLAFQSNAPALHLSIALRMDSDLRLTFDPAAKGLAQEVPLSSASLAICGHLFRELWADQEACGETSIHHPL